MNSCHEEGVCDRNRAGIEVAHRISIPAILSRGIGMMLGKQTRRDIS
eukprot:gene26766-biopygen17318